jgi:hypothetical protein
MAAAKPCDSLNRGSVEPGFATRNADDTFLQHSRNTSLKTIDNNHNFHNVPYDAFKNPLDRLGAGS